MSEVSSKITVTEKKEYSKEGDLVNIFRECDACLDSLKQGKLSYKNFEIVKNGQSKFDVEIKEALLIKT